MNGAALFLSIVFCALVCGTFVGWVLYLAQDDAIEDACTAACAPFVGRFTWERAEPQHGRCECATTEGWKPLEGVGLLAFPPAPEATP